MKKIIKNYLFLAFQNIDYLNRPKDRTNKSTKIIKFHNSHFLKKFLNFFASKNE